MEYARYYILLRQDNKGGIFNGILDCKDSIINMESTIASLQLEIHKQTIYKDNLECRYREIGNRGFIKNMLIE
jgi:hypothetical protein